MATRTPRRKRGWSLTQRLTLSLSAGALFVALVLGFLDLQMSQAQNRFHTDLEDWLATSVRDLGGEPIPSSAGVLAGPLGLTGRLTVWAQRPMRPEPR